MSDPRSATTIPHLMGIILDTEGVAYTKVIAINRTTRERLIEATDVNKAVIFDAANFTNGYTAGDVIEFANSGGSKGKATITISDATGGFQNVEMDCIASSTVSINL